MNPIGIALAFLVFWSLVAAGAFLTLSAGGRLRRVGLRVRGGAVPMDAGIGVAVALHAITALLGAMMILVGVYATYIVILAR
jgi:hypothetical protein